MVSGLPESAICFFRDGSKMCCVYGDFQNLQVSPAGFGGNFDEALKDLQKNSRHSHVNLGDGTDACKRCGLDLRNDIHFRVGE